jgi:predicted Zn-dependent peptidase
MRRLGLVLCLAAWLAGPAAAQEKFRKTPPPPEPLAELKLPAIESTVLANGLTFSIVPWTSAPLMSLQLVLDAGEVRSPDNLPGLATCAAHLFLRGTRLRSAADIEETIDSIGGRMTMDVTQDHVFVTFLFLDEALDTVLALLGQMLLQPAFSERELGNVRLTLSYTLRDNEKDPEFAGRRHLLRLLFEGHPYSRYAFTRDAARAWTMRDVAAFTDRFYRPNTANLILAGNINKATAARKVSRYLGTLWQSRDIPPPMLPAPRTLDRDRICFLEVPGSKNCAICVGTLFPTPEVTERFPLSVLDQVLGGSTNSRLFMTLRESNGYAFSAFSEIDYFRTGALFLARTIVPPEYLVPSVRETLRILREPAQRPIPGEEIEQAKAMLMGGFPLRLARLEDFAARAGLVKAVGWGSEAWDKYYEPMWLVGAERVAEAAAKLLNAHMLIVIAGDKQACDEKLGQFDSVEYYDSKGQYQYKKERNPKEP